MDWLVTAADRAARRGRVMADLTHADLCRVVRAADEFTIAGLCGDPTEVEWQRLVSELRRVGLADM